MSDINNTMRIPTVHPTELIPGLKYIVRPSAGGPDTRMPPAVVTVLSVNVPFVYVKHTIYKERMILDADSVEFFKGDNDFIGHVIADE